MKTIRINLATSRTLAALVMLAGVAATAHANHYETTIQEGKTKSRSIRRELVGRPSVTVDRLGIVEARFDSSQNVLKITGLRPGRATVTFTAQVRVFNTGIPPKVDQSGGRRISQIPVEGSRDVQDTITVTVNPEPARRPAPPPGPPIVRQKTTRKTVEVGQGFSLDLKSVGESVKNVEALSSDHSVARAIVGTNFIAVRVNGEGECVLLVRGEARNTGGRWEPFLRRVELSVKPKTARRS